jgi:hypothetical protein
VSLQGFEEEALSTVERHARIHEFELRYRPLFHVLAEPVNVLHCDSASLTAALTDLGGWAIRYASPGRASASRSYSARVGPLPLARAYLSLFEDGELVERAQADERGRASFSFDVSGPTKKACTVTLLPRPAPLANPLQDSFKLTAWLITVRLARTTDVWLRLVGRSFNEELPRIFWREKPWWTIGLGFVGAFFVDLVPVFGDATMTLYYGISAWCNTPEPYPSHEKCLEYRRRTWWTFEIECFNGRDRKRFSHDINIDRQVKLTATADDVRSEVVRPRGAET